MFPMDRHAQRLRVAQDECAFIVEETPRRMERPHIGGRGIGISDDTRIITYPSGRARMPSGPEQSEQGIAYNRAIIGWDFRYYSDKQERVPSESDGTDHGREN